MDDDFLRKNLLVRPGYGRSGRLINFTDNETLSVVPWLRRGDTVSSPTGSSVPGALEEGARPRARELNYF